MPRKLWPLRIKSLFALVSGDVLGLQPEATLARIVEQIEDAVDSLKTEGYVGRFVTDSPKVRRKRKVGSRKFRLKGSVYLEDCQQTIGLEITTRDRFYKNNPSVSLSSAGRETTYIIDDPKQCESWIQSFTDGNGKNFKRGLLEIVRAQYPPKPATQNPDAQPMTAGM